MRPQTPLRGADDSANRAPFGETPSSSVTGSAQRLIGASAQSQQSPIDGAVRRAAAGASSSVSDKENRPAAAALARVGAGGGVISSMKAAVANAAPAPATATKKTPVETRTIELQTNLSYGGDCYHGRSVLVRSDNPQSFVSASTAVGFGLGMMFSLLMGAVSYLMSWRLRDSELVMQRGGQEFFRNAYPFLITLGAFIIYGIALPCLGMVASGYLDVTRHDGFFMLANLCFTVFFGLPAVVIESTWLLPLTKADVELYPSQQLAISRFACATHYFVTGGFLWWMYLTVIVRKLNAAVNARSRLWYDFRRGLTGRRVCEASRIAIRTVEEIEETQVEQAATFGAPENRGAGEEAPAPPQPTAATFAASFGGGQAEAARQQPAQQTATTFGGLGTRRGGDWIADAVGDGSPTPVTTLPPDVGGFGGMTTSGGFGAGALRRGGPRGRGFNDE